jgi:hypothetical protein
MLICLVLTPFGRQQLYDLGVSTRMKYGFLLQVCFKCPCFLVVFIDLLIQNFTEKNAIPVFRTESQYVYLS